MSQPTIVYGLATPDRKELITDLVTGKYALWPTRKGAERFAAEWPTPLVVVEFFEDGDGWVPGVSDAN